MQAPHLTQGVRFLQAILSAFPHTSIETAARTIPVFTTERFMTSGENYFNTNDDKFVKGKTNFSYVTVHKEFVTDEYFIKQETDSVSSFIKSDIMFMALIKKGSKTADIYFLHDLHDLASEKHYADNIDIQRLNLCPSENNFRNVETHVDLVEDLPDSNIIDIVYQCLNNREKICKVYPNWRKRDYLDRMDVYFYDATFIYKASTEDTNKTIIPPIVARFILSMACSNGYVSNSLFHIDKDGRKLRHKHNSHILSTVSMNVKGIPKHIYLPITTKGYFSNHALSEYMSLAHCNKIVEFLITMCYELKKFYKANDANYKNLVRHINATDPTISSRYNVKGKNVDTERLSTFSLLLQAKESIELLISNLTSFRLRDYIIRVNEDVLYISDESSSQLYDKELLSNDPRGDKRCSSLYESKQEFSIIPIIQKKPVNVFPNSNKMFISAIDITNHIAKIVNTKMPTTTSPNSDILYLIDNLFTLNVFLQEETVPIIKKYPIPEVYFCKKADTVDLAIVDYKRFCPTGDNKHILDFYNNPGKSNKKPIYQFKSIELTLNNCTDNYQLLELLNSVTRHFTDRNIHQVNQAIDELINNLDSYLPGVNIDDDKENAGPFCIRPDIDDIVGTPSVFSPTQIISTFRQNITGGISREATILRMRLDWEKYLDTLGLEYDDLCYRDKVLTYLTMCYASLVLKSTKFNLEIQQ